MAADLKVPVFTKLEEAHPDPVIAAREAVRWNALAETFTARFGHPPTHIARAPGRVNIIGEHVDYALFGVFPAAVEQDILIACAPAQPRSPPHSTAAHNAYTSAPGVVRAQNLSPKYGPQNFAPVLRTQNGTDGWYLDIDKTQLRWESYVKAGYYGVLNRFFDPATVDPADPDAAPVPVDLLFTGTVPAGSGLSSSAAMVVASTLAFMAINDKLGKVTKGELVELAMENERRVGVNSGGMDQAASVISLPHSALFINFFPLLHAEPVPLPLARTARRGVFVVANSLVVADKVVSAKWHYNLRVVETLVGARVLGRVLASLPGARPEIAQLLDEVERPTHREVLGAYLGVREVKGRTQPALSVGQLREGLERLLVEVERLRGSALRGDAPSSSSSPPSGDEETGVTMDEMVRFSGLDAAAFQRVYLSWVEVEATHFQLYKRAKHVFSEALRVLAFRDVCLSVAPPPASSTSSSQTPPSTTQTTATATATATTTPTDPLPESILQTLGALMSASQSSCAALFDCSCPELDALTRICLASGAYGSRLTGAGWGGCTISLVAEDDLAAFTARVREAYPPYRVLDDEALGQAMFATHPSSGAFVFKLED